MDDIERVARAAVEEGAERIRGAWRAGKRVEYKGAVDLVTETDREVEALVTARLRAAFPDHQIVAEEASGGATAHRPPEDRYVWYVDPLDGTTNFAHAFPQFAVSIALAKGAERLFGIVCDPVRDETFVARKGEGATLNGVRVRVSDTDELDGALLATGFAYDRRERSEFYLSFFGEFMCRAQGLRRLGSAALDLCYVACGRFDGFWEWKLHPWDTAAGALVVREAGGHVTDFRGGAYDPFADQILASNGRIHEEMARVIRRVG